MNFHDARTAQGLPPAPDAVLCPHHPDVALAEGGECGRCGWSPTIERHSIVVDDDFAGYHCERCPATSQSEYDLWLTPCLVSA